LYPRKRGPNTKDKTRDKESRKETEPTKSSGQSICIDEAFQPKKERTSAGIVSDEQHTTDDWFPLSKSDLFKTKEALKKAARENWLRESEAFAGLKYESVARVRSRPPVRNQHKVLRILIGRKEHIACADSGSAKSIVSKSLVTRENWEIRREPEDLKDFEMGSGKCTRSIGRVRVSVQLPGKTLQNPKQWFYVFETCAVDMVLEMEFLEEAEILTKNRHLLEACPAELRDFSALLWIGSPKHDDSGGFIRNRLRCSLDGRDLVAVAATGSDLNMMSFECAKRERFPIDTREEARAWVKFGDGSKSRTVGQVYVCNLSLDWRTTETPASKKLLPNLINKKEKVNNGHSQEEEDEDSFCTVFHVLPGLPCDVIFGRDLLDQLDAFNRCPDLMPSLSAGKDNHFEFKVLISLGRLTAKLRRSKNKQASNTPVPHTKEAHDSERFSEIFRRSRRKEEIALMPQGQQDQARAREERRVRVWDAAHSTCVHYLSV
jgi:hypothetical protein